VNACHIAPQHINSDRVVEPKPPPTTSSIVNIPINPMPPHSNHEATAKRFTSNPQMQLVTIPNGYNGYRVCIIVHSMICTLFESFQRYTSFGCKTGSIELNQYLIDLQTKFNIKQSIPHQITTPCIYLHQKENWNKILSTIQHEDTHVYDRWDVQCTHVYKRHNME